MPTKAMMQDSCEGSEAAGCHGWGWARVIAIAVEGKSSAIQAELAASGIGKALKLPVAPVKKTLFILSDSLSAIHLLCCWRRTRIIVGSGK